MSEYLTVPNHIAAELKEAAYHLLNHGVIAFPTETVMGLGVVYDDEFAYNRLNIIKRRPEDKPYALMVQAPDQIPLFANLNKEALKIVEAFLPGPLTILVNAKKDVPVWVTHGTGVIGIRVTSDPKTNLLLTYVGKPLLVPSANRSGEKPCMSSNEVIDVFGEEELDYIVNGEAPGGTPSTILDLTGPTYKIVRQGPITKEMIDAVLNKEPKVLTLAIGSDHAGFDYKERLINDLTNKGYKLIDCGTFSKDSCHYPLFAHEVANHVAKKTADFGILVCSSGEGIMIAANKVKGVRAGLAYNDAVAGLLREHNNANVIAFGANFMEYEDVLRRVEIFLSTEFAGGRHQTRVDLIEK